METHPNNFRVEYISKCKENVASILKDNKVLIHYIRDDNGATEKSLRAKIKALTSALEAYQKDNSIPNDNTDKAALHEQGVKALKLKVTNNQKIGVLVATKPEGTTVPLIGWSLCKTKAEPFNKYIGLMKAFSRIEEGCPFVDEDTPFLPNSVEAVLPKFEDRIKRYFKSE